MAEIALQRVSVRKLALSMGQAAAGDTAQVGANKNLVVHNGDVAAHTVTLAIPGTGITGAATPDMVESVAAGEIAVIPLLDIYADATQGGQAVITYDATPATLKRTVIAF